MRRPLRRRIAPGAAERLSRQVSGASILVHATSLLLGAAAAPFGGPHDIAVLLLGASGSGKSDLALRLIAAGARLVSDDQTSLSVEQGRLVARAPERLTGLLEIRGVGIVAVGAAQSGPIALVVKLQSEPPDRLPEPDVYNPPGLQLADPAPVIRLDPFESSAAAKVAAAACAAALGRFVAGAGAGSER